MTAGITGIMGFQRSNRWPTAIFGPISFMSGKMSRHWAIRSDTALLGSFKQRLFSMRQGSYPNANRP
ncbi:MAG: hypothetical protein HQL93_13480 [Magnetococcales bacterium]|nr:hypothetical protein [Magnetococcales bacterium]